MRRIITRSSPLLLALLCLLTTDGYAQGQGKTTVTRIVIRAVARDAKIIGDDVGGARITVVNARTGEMLAEGKQEGGTGDTRLIMEAAHGRNQRIYDTDGAAAFVAELAIDKPTVVNITATGPLGYPQATMTASRQMLVVPGENIVGDGVILVLNGFIVEIVEPEPLDPLGKTIEVKARVQMMCGCPIQRGGMWNADRISIQARLWADGELLTGQTMYATKLPSMFSAVVRVPSEYGDRQLELEVLAVEGATGNFGRHAIPIGGR